MVVIPCREARFEERRKIFFDNNQEYIKIESLLRSRKTIDPALRPQPQKSHSTLKDVESILGVRLLALQNICYNLYDHQTYLYSMDDKKLPFKSLPESIIDVGFRSVINSISFKVVELQGGSF